MRKTLAIAAMTLTMVAGVLGFSSSPASADLPGLYDNFRAKEECKVDTGYHVMLGRGIDNGGYNYWMSHIDAGLTNGNWFINVGTTSSWEYNNASYSTKFMSDNDFITRLFVWAYGYSPSAGQRGWYQWLIDTQGRSQAATYSTNDAGTRCADAFTNAFYPMIVINP